jgi:hypothetical protein
MGYFLFQGSTKTRKIKLYQVSKMVIVLVFTYSYQKQRYIFFSYASNHFSNTSPFIPAPDSSDLIPVAFGCFQT